MLLGNLAADLDRLTNGGFTPRLCAIHLGCGAEERTKTLDYLFSKRADINAHTAHSWSALHAAVASPKPAQANLVQYLLRHGLQVESKSYSGYSRSFPVTLWKENMEIMLRECPKNLTRDESPLHWAAKIGDVEAAKMLLDSGAELHARDSNGASLLIRVTHGLCGRVDPQTVITLLEREADADAKDNRGLSAKDWARQNHFNFDWQRQCVIEIQYVHSSNRRRGGHRGSSG
jgi:ankyrin repeat protein